VSDRGTRRTQSSDLRRWPNTGQVPLEPLRFHADRYSITCPVGCSQLLIQQQYHPELHFRAGDPYRRRDVHGRGRHPPSPIQHRCNPQNAPGLLPGRKRLTVIFKTALSYPGNKRFRTGATVAMFALVLLSVTTIAFLTAEQGAALNDLIKQDSGGYDVVTQTTLPVANLAAQIGNDASLNGKVAAVIPF